MKLTEIMTSGKKGYEAFVLDEPSRQTLAKVFPPKYPEWIGHHITFEFGVQKGTEGKYGGSQPVKVVGYAEDNGIEVLVVSVGGVTIRPDGKKYHITWSLDRSKGWKPVDSNKVIQDKGFKLLDRPIPINTTFEFLY